MNEQELIKICINRKDTELSYPFSKDPYCELPVLRHKSNGKWFALVFCMDEKLYINLKSNPVDSAFLRDMYEFIAPAWHMNKTHWIKIDVNSAPVDLLEDLIQASFKLTE